VPPQQLGGERLLLLHDAGQQMARRGFRRAGVRGLLFGQRQGRLAGGVQRQVTLLGSIQPRRQFASFNLPPHPHHRFRPTGQLLNLGVFTKNSEKQVFGGDSPAAEARAS